MNKNISKAFGILFLLLELAIVPKAIDLMLNQPLASLPPIKIVALSMTFGSIALCIILSYSSMSEHNSYPKHTFLFETAVFLCCMAPMTDLITKALDTAGKPSLNMFVNTIYYLIGINIAYVITVYEYLIIDAEKKPFFKKAKQLATIITILDNAATLLNIRFGFFFTINEQGTYQSAPTYWTAYIAPAIVIAITVITAAKEMSPGRQKRAFLSFWAFAMIFSSIQAWQSELSVQYTGFTLSLIVIYINIQSELDALDAIPTERK